MRVADYNQQVIETDHYSTRPRKERLEIAIYGLAGEIGSLLAAVKKKLLAEDGELRWDQPNDEIVEEIGDVIWYCFSLSQIANDKPVNILTHAIALLKKEIGSDDERAKKIHAVLDPASKTKFLAAAEMFPRTKDMCFDDYQSLAFLTARTQGKVLLEVCLAVLWQLGAELLRTTLPKIEATLNTTVADRPINQVLGEIAWHLAAFASLYSLSLDEIVEKNVKKLNFRKRGVPTKLHDEGLQPGESFARKFDVQFVSIGPGKLRMYSGGKRLGDDLTDNAHKEDGYRFHDILHLSLIAHLGWSPVMRKLMKRKRRYDQRIDEVEDGARAQIVEELVIKAIHSEGDKIVNEQGRCSVDGPAQMFPSKSLIPFRFLKTIQKYVEGLEVSANAYWEWDNAIFDGTNIFYQLRKEGQGTVSIDMIERKITFSPDVCINLKGSAVGLGIGFAKSLPGSNPEELRRSAAKSAILSCLGLPHAEGESLVVNLLQGSEVCVKANGSVQLRMRERLILDFRVAFTESDGDVTCSAMALADPGDLAK